MADDLKPGIAPGGKVIDAETTRVLRQLQQRFTSPNPDVRAQAAAQLMRLPESHVPRAIPMMVRGLNDQFSGVRRASLRALNTHSLQVAQSPYAPQALDGMARLAQSDPSPAVRNLALDSVRAFRNVFFRPPQLQGEPTIAANRSVGLPGGTTLWGALGLLQLPGLVRQFDEMQRNPFFFSGPPVPDA